MVRRWPDVSSSRSPKIIEMNRSVRRGWENAPSVSGAWIDASVVESSSV